MNNLSLTLTEFQRLLKVFAWLTGGLWATIFFVQWQCLDIEGVKAAWRSFTPALAFSTLLFGVFYRIAWRSTHIAKWMRRPIVHGVWMGTLQSDYLRSAESPLVLPIYFVIRQTYLTLSIESFTAKQEGESTLEALIQNARTEATRLRYVFELRRQYQAENKLTTGSGVLRLVEGGRRLRGHYWTNTPTYGELDLKLVSRDCDDIDCFEVAEAKWPFNLKPNPPNSNAVMK